MIDIEDIRMYLPKYLSAPAEDDLFAELQKFPENMDKLYTTYRKDDPVIYQGDGIEGLLVINLPETEIRPTRAMVLSNTCDIGPDKKVVWPNCIVYSPILNLSKYMEQVSLKRPDKDFLLSHEGAIKKQRISSVFYLPKGGGLNNDSLMFFDRVVSCSRKSIENLAIQKSRLFTLSNFGLYLFLFKLSIHFTRIREGIDREAN